MAFGQPKHERVNRQQYQTRAKAKSDIFDYIELFYNPRRRKKLERIKLKHLCLTQPSVVTG
ncbi:MAG: IS3 family transposase [Gammaproteobacteria bacterium]|nr:IS3 family transposase [Gammaproteobacteria bacterium]